MPESSTSGHVVSHRTVGRMAIWMRIASVHMVVVLLVALSGRRRHGRLLSLELPVLIQIYLERLHVVFEAKGGHPPEKIIAVDGFPLLSLALVRGLAGNEADELRHTFLHRLLRVFGDFRIPRQRPLHYPPHVRYGEQAILLSNVVAIAILRRLPFSSAASSSAARLVV